VTALRDAAIGYGRRGRPVFPVDLDKKPLTRHGFQDATTDERTIGRWWTEHPDAGISTPTGDTPGVRAPDWFVLDDDTAGRAIAELQAEHGPLPPTVTVATPRPGLHVYLLGEATNSDSALPEGLNVRGQGGYVLLPPSPHRNGTYEWRTAPDEAPIARAPGWLLELLASPANGAGCGEHQPPARPIVAGDGRHSHMKDFAIRMLRAGVIDEDRIAAHLELEFRLSCELQPAPTPGYFAKWARWAVRSQIADRERSIAELEAALPDAGWWVHGG
jgi:hypothetical protein